MYLGTFRLWAAACAVLLLIVSSDRAYAEVSATDVDSPGNVKRGETITHTIEIKSTGSDATGMNFSEELDPGTTLVPDSLKTTPVAVDDPYSVNEDETLTISAPGVLGNDIDPYPVGDTKTAIMDTGPANGTLSLNVDGSFTYTPDANFNGDDSFTYTVTDSTPASDGATVTITVTAVNDPPTDIALSAMSVTENQPTGTAVGTFSTTDIDSGEPFTYTLAAGTGDADNASFQIVGNQLQTAATFDFETKPSYSIRVRSTDTGSLFFEKVFIMTVTDVNEAPVLNDASRSINENSPNGTTVGAVLSFTDQDTGQSHTFAITAGNASGAFAINNSGQITVADVTDLNYEVMQSFTLTVQVTDDGTPALNDTATVTISVDDINEAPTAGADLFNYISNTELRVDGHTGTETALAYTTSTTNPADNDSDPDVLNPAFRALSVVLAGPAATAQNGEFQIAADGSFRYTPPAGFTGTDTVSYSLTDGANTVTGTITLTMAGAQKVWYVRNNDTTSDDAANRDGTSTYPFNTLLGAQSASAANDTIYVAYGTGTNTGQNAGFTLKTGQKLWGEAHGLTFDPDGVGPLPATILISPTPGSRPFIGNTGGIAVAGTNVTGAEVRGFSISASTDAIALVTTAANSGGIAIGNNIITSAGNEGIDIDAGGTGTTTVQVHDNTITSTGNAIDITRTAGTLYITAFDDNVISGNTAGSGIVVNGATFDATPGGSYQQVPGGTTVIGAPSNGVGLAGMLLSSVAGDLAFTDLDIFADGGAGLSVVGTGAVNTVAGTGTRVTVGAGAGIIEATGGPAADLSSMTTDLQLNSLRSTNSSATGVSLTNVSGTFSAPAGSSITNAAGADFNINGGNATVTYNGTITDDVGLLVSIVNTTGGTKAFTGAITDGNDGDGSGISLTNNAGATTIRFSGGVVLNTGANAAFTATGGGTVEVCDENPCNPAATGALVNTLTTTTGAALNITTTTIGSNNLEFRSISSTASGSSNGIVLSSTGSSGGLKVKGTGTAGSGGTIANKTGSDGSTTQGSGIYLNNTSNVLLSRMQLNDFQNFGIKGVSVNGFAMDNCVINATGSAMNGTNQGGSGEGSMDFDNLTGTVSITNSTITHSIYNSFAVVNTSSGTLDLTVSDTTFATTTTAGFGGDAVLIEARKPVSGTTTINATFENDCDFTSARGDLLDVIAQTGSTVNIDVLGNDFSNNHAAVASGGGGVIFHGSGTMDFLIENNDLQNAKGRALNVSKGSYGGVFTGTINNNRIGISGQEDSGSIGASGIFVDGAGAGSMTIEITNNLIRQTNEAGIYLIANNQTVDGNNATLHATVTGNLVTEPSLVVNPYLTFAGIFADIGVETADASFACLDIGGAGSLANDFSAGDPNNLMDIDLAETSGVSVRLPGYLSGATDTVAIANYLKNRNSNAAETAAYVFATGYGYTGGAACNQP